tara:strand:+ start:114 stop:287 length:174 start_codon:yes stop_codon:yes gene_type:complete
MVTKTDKKKQELTDAMLKELDELTDILSGYFSIGIDKETYKIKRRDNVKRTRSNKKS